MPTFAVLGATGNCGTAVIELLLREQDTKIHAYCRNKQKLINKIPDVANEDRVSVFEGSIFDSKLMQECIRNTDAVFHLVSTNDNVPGYRTGYDTASSIVAAIESIQSIRPHDTSRTPSKLILLSSGTVDERLSSHIAPPFRLLLRTAFSYVYEDLRRTEIFLRSKANVVSTVFIKPGGLALDIQRGHRLNFDHDESFVSYLDLAAGMIEAAADDQNRYEMQNVSVVNQQESATMPSGLLMGLSLGLLRHFFPFLHQVLPLMR